MRKIVIMLSIAALLGLVGCANDTKVSVPENIKADVQVQPITGEVIFKHVLTIELPSVFTDSCRARFNEQTHPNVEERSLLYNKCITDYINSLMSIINSINPNQLPAGVTL